MILTICCYVFGFGIIGTFMFAWRSC